MREQDSLVYLKIGGSSTIDDQGVNEDDVESLLNLLLPDFEKTNLRLIIGGGRAARKAMQDLRAERSDVTDKELDELGMSYTRIHAATLASLIAKWGWKTHDQIPDSSQSLKEILSSRELKSFVAGGTHTGQSTDAVLMETIEADLLAGRRPGRVAILSNIKTIFTEDPANVTLQAIENGQHNIRAFKKVSVATLKQLHIIRDAFQPGMKTPVDPVAIQRFIDLQEYDYAPSSFWLGSTHEDDGSLVNYLQGNESAIKSGTIVTAEDSEPIYYDDETTKQWLLAWHKLNNPEPSPQ